MTILFILFMHLPSESLKPAPAIVQELHVYVCCSLTALLARVEVLESENQQLKVKLQMVSSERRGFRVEDIAHDDNLVRMYTGFSSYVILLAFFEFLGPSVHELNY